MPENKEALIVFAKVPEPGKVKTRLTALLDPEWAASLYEAFLLDAIELYRTLPADVRLYFTVSADAVPEKYVFSDIPLCIQKGDGLGARMATAFAETFVLGYERAVIIGTDHPTLPVEFIEQAFAHLNEPLSLTIGPSEDGGYYLLGMNEFYPQLFQNMTYSHDQVFSDTLNRAEQLQAQLNILPLWYDVDTPDALKKLIGELENSSIVLRRTRKSIQLLIDKYPSLKG